MPTVRDLLKSVEELAPPHLAFSFDHVGLQVGDPSAEATRVAVSLDSSLAAVRFAIENGCNALVSHHPVIWDALPSVRSDDVRQRVVVEMIRGGLSFIAAHTNWDCAEGGINDALADRLGLTDAKPFGYSTRIERLKMAVFAPKGSEAGIIDAASAAGAGVIGAYSRCAVTHPVTGTFLGGEGSSPVIGQAGEIEEVDEVRIEMVLDAAVKPAVDKAVRKAHPYEEPAIDYLLTADQNPTPAGRIGSLASPLSGEELVRHVDEALQTRSWIWPGHDRPIKRVAVVGGAADSDWKAALADGADAYVTGEVKQNVAIEASESGLTILASGHYATEQPGVEVLAEKLRQSGWDTLLFSI